MGVSETSLLSPDAQVTCKSMAVGTVPARRQRIEGHPSLHSGVRPPGTTPETTS